MSGVYASLQTRTRTVWNLRRAEGMEREARWLASVNPKIPLHVKRFFPRYHMKDRDATDVQCVYELAQIARKHLENVFVGNC